MHVRTETLLLCQICQNCMGDRLSLLVWTESILNNTCPIMGVSDECGRCAETIHQMLKDLPNK